MKIHFIILILYLVIALKCCSHKIENQNIWYLIDDENMTKYNVRRIPNNRNMKMNVCCLRIKNCYRSLDSWSCDPKVNCKMYYNILFILIPFRKLTSYIGMFLIPSFNKNTFELHENFVAFAVLGEDNRSQKYSSFSLHAIPIHYLYQTLTDS